jgi:uncharacterized protein YjbI with pentapeptide repeats
MAPVTRRKLGSEELRRIIASHRQWLESDGEKGERADLSAADLAGAALGRALLPSADLAQADLSRAVLDQADLREADFFQADLTAASLRGANLRDTDFDHAHLAGARLDGADLTGACLDEADLAGAVLDGARLDGAELGVARGLTQAQLAAAVGDADTRLPPGLSVPIAKGRTRS